MIRGYEKLIPGSAGYNGLLVLPSFLVKANVYQKTFLAKANKYWLRDYKSWYNLEWGKKNGA